MLDIQRLRENPALVRQAMQHKGIPQIELVDDILALDEKRRATLTEVQAIKARSNSVAREIGQLMKQGKRTEAQTLIAENAQLKDAIKAQEDEARTTEADLHKLMLEIPNIPHPSVPVGKTEADNQVVFEHGTPPRV